MVIISICIKLEQKKQESSLKLLNSFHIIFNNVKVNHIPLPTYELSSNNHFEKEQLEQTIKWVVRAFKFFIKKV